MALPREREDTASASTAAPMRRAPWAEHYPPTVKVPAAAPCSRSISPWPREAQSPMETTDLVRRVLVVDDNPAIHEDFRKVLAPRGQKRLRGMEEDEVALF